MAPKDLDKLIKKYLQGKCTEDEAKFIDSWYSSLGDDATTKEALDEAKASQVESRVLGNLYRHTGSKGGSHLYNPPLWRFSAIAASLLLLIVTGYFLFNGTLESHYTTEKATMPQFITIQNAEQHPKRVILPDGSIVALSQHSKIRFLNDPNSPSRELFLEGEAYFDVAHDHKRPFYVYVGNIVTKVLGTSFVIKALDKHGKVTVSVKTGKVSVYSKNVSHKKVVLTPNQEAVYDKVSGLVATQVVTEKKADHHQQTLEMHFDETPVSEVLMTLEKAYTIEILFDKEILSGCVLTSTFIDEGFYDRMDIICTAIGATYKVAGAQVKIESNGCKGFKTQRE